MRPREGYNMRRRPRVLMITADPGLSGVARRAAGELQLDLEIRSVPFEEVLNSSGQWEREGFDCAVSHGAIGVLLKYQLSIPVFLVPVTGFDILQALRAALDLSPHPAYIDHVHRMNAYDFPAMGAFLGLEELKCYFFCNMEMLEEQLALAAAEGIRAVVAPDEAVLLWASGRGMAGIPVPIQHEAVYETLARARELLKYRQKDREHNLFLQTVVNGSGNAIVALDRGGNVLHLNEMAENIFGLAGARGRPFATLPGLQELQKLLGDNGRASGLVLSVHGRRVVVDCTPLFAGGEFLGTVITAQQVTKIQQMEASIRRELYAKGLVSRFGFEDLVERSQVMQNARAMALRFAARDSTVLLSGESGTGKELFAHSIHRAGPRSHGPFVSINCAAIPENLLESELFGYDDGAFTGARKGGSPGLFELAHGGTLFLDEVSEMPLTLQARLLRVLQEKAVRRVGGDRLIPVDVRIIAATNQDLAGLAARGRFRLDLYFRLNVLHLDLPPLRERPEDILPLLDHFARKHNAGALVSRLPSWASRRLQAYGWPGNVRELENFVERLSVISPGASGEEYEEALHRLLGDLHRFPPGEGSGHPAAPGSSHLLIRIDTLEEMERQILRQMRDLNGTNKVELARRLGISRTTLWKKLRESDTRGPEPEGSSHS